MLILIKIILTLVVTIILILLADYFADKGSKVKDVIATIGGAMVIVLILLVAVLVLWLIWGGVQV